MPNAAPECNSSRTARNRPDDRLSAIIPKDSAETAHERPPTPGVIRLILMAARRVLPSANLRRQRRALTRSCGKPRTGREGTEPARNHLPADCKSDFQPPIRAQAVLEQAQSARNRQDTRRGSRDDSRAGQRTGAAGSGRSDQGDHHPDVREGRHRGVKAPAGADRLLGAVVRPLPPAHADHRKGRPCRERQGQAGQDEHRRTSGDSRPDGDSIDPGRDRVRQRPACRRLHGRGSGKPGHRLHQQADGGHAGYGRAQYRRNPAGGRSRSGRGRSRPRRRRSMPRCWPRTPPISQPSPGSRNAT